MHPLRAGRRARQIGRKGQSHQRWMVGGKLASSVHQHGQGGAWDGAPANVYDAVCHPRIADFADHMVVVTDMGCPLKGRFFGCTHRSCKYFVERVPDILIG